MTNDEMVAWLREQADSFDERASEERYLAERAEDEGSHYAPTYRDNEREREEDASACRTIADRLEALGRVADLASLACDQESRGHLDDALDALERTE